MSEPDNNVMVIDIIDNSKNVVAFLRDVAGCSAVQEYLTPDGFEGFSYILGKLNNELMHASDMLQAK